MPSMSAANKTSVQVPAKRGPELDDNESVPNNMVHDTSDDDASIHVTKTTHKTQDSTSKLPPANKRKLLTGTSHSTTTPPASKTGKSSLTGDVKPSIENKPPVKRARTTKPRPAPAFIIGAQVVARPFNSGLATFKNFKVLATVEERAFDSITKGWVYEVTLDGAPMPPGTRAWLSEKLLDGGFELGDLVSVKVNGGWCDGVVSGKTVEGDDGWGYEVEVVGRVRVGPKDIKAMTEVGKLKAEKLKTDSDPVKEEQ